MVLRFVPLSPPRDSVQYTSLPSPIYRSWQKKKLHRSLAGHCDHLAIPYFSAEHGSCLSRQSDPPTFCQKNPKFLDTSNLQLLYYYPLGESLSTVVKRSSLFNNTEKKYVTTKLLKSWCTIFVARKRSQDAAISHTSFQSSWTSINVNFLTNSPKTLPPLWENLLPADFSCWQKVSFFFLIVFYLHKDRGAKYQVEIRVCSLIIFCANPINDRLLCMRFIICIPS